MKQTGKTVRFILTVALIVFANISLSANGLNLNGVGSKAIAMGGAFIGQADDYSAIFWNPAGLVQMKNPSLSFFATALMPTGTYAFPAYGVDAQTKAGIYPSGALTYFKPISEKLVIGIGAYVPAGSGAEWDVEDLKALTFNKTKGSAGNTLIWKSMIGVISLSPVVSYKISDSFSMGASLNINYAFMKLQKPATLQFLSLKFAEQYKEDTTAVGFGATFGMMLKPVDTLSIGLTVRTPVSITFKGDATNDLANNFVLQLAAPGIPIESGIERKATWPLWAGLGISFKPMDKLTLNADLQFTQWEKLQAIEADYDNALWQARFAAGGKLDLKWEDKIQYRVGMEYAISDKLAMRAGYYYDPSPSPAETLSILLPEITYNVITVGFGYKTDKISLDFCFETLLGKDQESPLAGGIMPGTHGMNIMVPNIAFTLYL